MIITPKEIEQLKAKLDDCWGDPWSQHMSEQEGCLNFLAQHPHLLIPLGFSEARVFDHSPENVRTLEARFDVINVYVGSCKRRIAYRRPEGGWYLVGRPGWQKKGGPPLVPFFAEKGGVDFELSIAEPVNALDSLPNGTLNLRSLTVFPTFPPRIKVASESEAAVTALELIQRIQDLRMNLVDLKPYELEDVVAELMRSRGHKVLQTKRTRDGGRDIIVRGEFLPDVMAEMAVEVTTQGTVGIGKLAKALHQNRHFPLIMIATSGRFSAGVMHEREQPDNRMKLQLVDGATLWDWVRTHGEGYK